jgi:uncharacterized protein (TIGR03083 family)
LSRNLARMTHPASTWITALRGSHERLRDLVAPLTPDQVAGQAYPSEWSIAQVLSHLGSGAEIFVLILGAARAGEPAPGVEVMRPVWDVWNAKSPQDQAADAIPADRRLVELFEEVAAGPDAGLTLNFIGRELDLGGLASMRLNEHALHSWDVAVSVDPSAPVAAPAVELLIDTVGFMVSRAAKPAPTPTRVHVHTTAPAREFELTVGEKASLLPWPADGPPADAELHLPAEALLRLFAGRLDEAHTPAGVSATGIELDDLRTVFPGY